MHALLLGYSSIARRRILPAMKSLGWICDVASVNNTSDASKDPYFGNRVFANYDRALEESNAGIVYVSTHNAGHAALSEAALQSGRHVIVDKPAFLTFSETKRLLRLAESHRLCLAEATVYLFHPRYAEALRIFEAADSQPKHISLTFSFPPLQPSNFRYDHARGGGAILDLGPYAASCARFFFGQEPCDIVGAVTCLQGDVDVSFSLLALYPGGKSLTGHFGFTTGYCNRVQLMGPRVYLELLRAFTSPGSMITEIVASVDGVPGTRSLPPTDAFAVFLSEVERAITANNWDAFSRALESDSRTLERILMNSNSAP